MPILLIGEKEKAEITAAIERARKHPLPWDVGRQIVVPDAPSIRLADRRPGAPPRKHRPEQVLLPIGYRVMVSFEEQPAGILMHLSISVERADPKWAPGLPQVAMIAQAFGIKFPHETAKLWVEEYEPGRNAINMLKIIAPREEHSA